MGRSGQLLANASQLGSATIPSLDGDNQIGPHPSELGVARIGGVGGRVSSSPTRASSASWSAPPRWPRRDRLGHQLARRPEHRRLSVAAFSSSRTRASSAPRPSPTSMAATRSARTRASSACRTPTTSVAALNSSRTRTSFGLEYTRGLGRRRQLIANANQLGLMAACGLMRDRSSSRTPASSASRALAASVAAPNSARSRETSASGHRRSSRGVQVLAQPGEVGLPSDRGLGGHHEVRPGGLELLRAGIGRIGCGSELLAQHPSSESRDAAAWDAAVSSSRVDSRSALRDCSRTRACGVGLTISGGSEQLVVQPVNRALLLVARLDRDSELRLAGGPGLLRRPSRSRACSRSRSAAARASRASATSSRTPASSASRCSPRVGRNSQLVPGGELVSGDRQLTLALSCRQR